MSDKNLKAIRGQIRQIVKDILPEVFTQELATKTQKTLQEYNEKRLDAIAKHLVDTLKQIDDRAKDTQAYILRNASLSNVAPTEEVTPPALDNG